MQSMFGLHDREQFEIHAYSFGPNGRQHVSKAESKKVASIFMTWRTCRSPTWRCEFATMEIQILVDLMGYTGLARTACTSPAGWAPISRELAGLFRHDRSEFHRPHHRRSAGHAARTCGGFQRENRATAARVHEQTDDQQPIAESAGKRADHGLPEDGLVFSAASTTPTKSIRGCLISG